MTPMAHIVALLATSLVAGLLAGFGYLVVLVVSLVTGNGMGGPLDIVLMPLLGGLVVALVTIVFVRRRGWYSRPCPHAGPRLARVFDLQLSPW